MPAIRVLASDVVYRNPMPHLVSRHAYFPSIVQIEGDKLTCAMDIGSAFESVDMRTYTCHTDDEGKNWSQPEMIFEPDESDHPVSTTCRIGKTSQNAEELMGWVCLFDRTHTDQGLANSTTRGFVNTDFATVTSKDYGKTWSTLNPVKLPMDWPAFECCYPVYSLGDQRLIVPASPWPDWNGKAPPQPNGLAWLSNDGGMTWPTAVETFTDSVDGLKAYEQKFATLSDGRLIVVCWSFDEIKNVNGPNRYAISDDRGQTFMSPCPTPLNGETCGVVGLDDNKVLCVYRRCDGKPGLWGHLARIEGTQWTPLCDQQLWGGPAYGQSDSENKVASMSQLRFGCPSVIRLADGDVMIAFWAVEDCVSNIRWIKLRVES